MTYPKNITRACCVCRRVQVGERWVTPTALAKQPVLLSHTYCPECYGRTMASMKIPALPLAWARRPGTLAVA